MALDNSAVELITFGIVAGLIVAGGGGYLYYEDAMSDDIEPVGMQSVPEKTTTHLNDDVVSLFNSLFGKGCGCGRTDDLEECINKLDIDIYGINNGDQDEIILDYIEKCRNDGYNDITRKEIEKMGFNTKVFFAKTLLHGRVIAVLKPTSEAVTFLSNYDLILLTSSGYLTDYLDCKEQFEDLL